MSPEVFELSRRMIQAFLGTGLGKRPKSPRSLALGVQTQVASSSRGLPSSRNLVTYHSRHNLLQTRLHPQPFSPKQSFSSRAFPAMSLQSSSLSWDPLKCLFISSQLIYLHKESPLNGLIRLGKLLHISLHSSSLYVKVASNMMSSSSNSPTFTIILLRTTASNQACFQFELYSHLLHSQLLSLRILSNTISSPPNLFRSTLPLFDRQQSDNGPQQLFKIRGRHLRRRHIAILLNLVGFLGTVDDLN